ncbi:protein BIG GRAIN 1-like A [Dioscorea cayenensis subsp. rotundata]|uniref:Protein BIG GRAIN 1-like A n=1 Tax=Dioscorea cayennensis subsp. rotundata TaxID=55577 RepID=A0AB40BLJ9_DIOCR|nr:protein BIG GRAIN 1-like A [Dioscorea cayenensis subsp. rotundata]
MDWYTRPPPSRTRDRPSFSSSLLDAIYRSIDQPDSATSLNKQNRGATDHPLSDKITTPVIPTPLPRRHSFVSTSTSSDSIFSSSSSSSSSAKTTTPVIQNPVHRRRSSSLDRDPPPPEKKSIRSRLRELRKSKTPASPGSRLASFLNSLFASASSSKKSKVRASSPEEPEMRSCLSKTPSSAGRSSGKRSVRFWPVGVLVGEDCQPCGSRWIYGGDRATRMAEMMRGLDEEENGDDVASDASSDLFELENLTVVGGGFSDELPVYETTYLRTNRSIASRVL